MATMVEVQQKAIEPMQRYWTAPKGVDETSLEFQIRELQEWCGQRSGDELDRAYRWLTENHGYSYWPRIADWKKAVQSTAANSNHKSEAKEHPWFTRQRQAKAIFWHSYAETGLAAEMKRLDVFQDYQAIMTRKIYDALHAGRSGHDCTLGSDYIEHLRKRGRALLAASEYRQTRDYKDVHGEGFDFSRAYPRRKDAFKPFEEGTSA